MKQTLLKMIFSGLMILCSNSLSAADLPDFPFIITAGEASREIKPDKAIISFNLLSFNADATMALKNLSTAFDASLELLESYQVPISAITASDLRRSITRSKNDERQSLQILGYQISRSVHVQIDDLEDYSELAEQLSGLANLSRFEATFDASNRAEIMKELLVEASKDAVREAQLTADVFGQRLDSVYAISEASDFGEFFATFGAHSYDSQLMLSDSRQLMKMFIPESIQIRRSINVVHRLN